MCQCMSNFTLMPFFEDYNSLQIIILFASQNTQKGVRVRQIESLRVCGPENGSSSAY